MPSGWLRSSLIYNCPLFSRLFDLVHQWLASKRQILKNDIIADFGYGKNFINDNVFPIIILLKVLIKNKSNQMKLICKLCKSLAES